MQNPLAPRNTLGYLRTAMPRYDPDNPRLSPLVPMPMRVTKQQQDRLRAAREKDGITLQDHVRRALDMYLDHMDMVYARRDQPLPEGQLGVAVAYPGAPPGRNAGAAAISSPVPKAVIR